MSDFVKAAGPVATLISTVVPTIAGAVNKPKMPKVEVPAPIATPLMPVKDDAAAKAAALKTIATKAAKHGRQSTNLFDKETLG